MTVSIVPPAFAISGGTFSYSCQVNDVGSNYVGIEWYHNGSLVFEESNRVTITNTRIDSNVESLLEVLSNVGRADEGDYYCRATFSDMDAIASDTHTLTIQGIYIHTAIKIYSAMFEAMQ